MSSPYSTISLHGTERRADDKTIKIPCQLKFLLHAFSLARFYSLIDLPEEEIKPLKETGNKVAHSDQNLVAQYSDVDVLAKAHNLFQFILSR